MSEEKKVSVGVFEGNVSEEELYEFEQKNALTGEVLGTFFLKNVKQPIIDRYRDLRNGEGRRKGDPQKAREYLFQKIFVRFEFADQEVSLDLGDSATPLQFFVKNCGKTVDAVLLSYLGEVFPDVDGKKSPTPLD